MGKMTIHRLVVEQSSGKALLKRAKAKRKKAKGKSKVAPTPSPSRPLLRNRLFLRRLLKRGGSCEAKRRGRPKKDDAE